jgi:hypothetical protein
MKEVIEHLLKIYDDHIMKLDTIYQADMAYLDSVSRSGTELQATVQRRMAIARDNFRRLEQAKLERISIQSHYEAEFG